MNMDRLTAGLAKARLGATWAAHQAETDEEREAWSFAAVKAREAEEAWGKALDIVSDVTLREVRRLALEAANAPTS